MIPLPPLNLDLKSSVSVSSGPAVSEQSGTVGMFDASNWNVNFSGTQSATNTSAQKATPATADAIATATSSPYVWAAVGIVVLAVLYKKMGHQK